MIPFGIYAGNMGYAHDFEVLMCSIEYCLKNRIIEQFYFIGDGRRRNEAIKLAKASENSAKISFLEYLSEEEFEQYVNGALFHAVVLKSNKLGVMVPSKFYTSMNSSKPVLYCGNRDSEIALDIFDYNLGYVVDSKDDIADLGGVDWKSLSINCTQYDCTINNKDIAAKNIVDFLTRWK